MNEIINFEDNVPEKKASDIIMGGEQALLSKSSEMLAAVKAELVQSASFTMPIANLSTLGAAISSLLPSIRTITSTASFASEGLYRITNALPGDVLKTNAAKTINYGALTTKAGKSKLTQLAEAGPISATVETVAPINPATMMMAVALYSIEKELGNISEMQKEILSFLEIEKESEIEGDIQTLGSMISDYKYNWNNELYVASNHKMVLDIKRTAKKNMLSYQKKVSEEISKITSLVAQSKVDATSDTLLKYFKYYRLSLFSYAMSTLMEIMLNGNFSEDYISAKKEELETLSLKYHEIFDRASSFLESLGEKSVKVKRLKAQGSVTHFLGENADWFPVINRGETDEILFDISKASNKKSETIRMKPVINLQKIKNPGIHTFIEQMDDICKISNHTSQICFDDNQIYLIE